MNLSPASSGYHLCNKSCMKKEFSTDIKNLFNITLVDVSLQYPDMMGILQAAFIVKAILFEEVIY